MGRCVRIEGEVLRRAQEFGIPETEVGALVASLPLTWAWVEDRLQAVVFLPRLVRYPQMVLATREELRELLGEVAV